MSDGATIQFKQLISPPDGLTASSWKRQVKGRFPKPAEGTCHEVPAELREQLAQAKLAAAFWENQVSLVKVRIRELMGGAEMATIAGQPFMIREIIPYKGHWVEAGDRDVLKPPPKAE